MLWLAVMKKHGARLLLGALLTMLAACACIGLFGVDTLGRLDAMLGDSPSWLLAKLFSAPPTFSCNSANRSIDMVPPLRGKFQADPQGGIGASPTPPGRVASPCFGMWLGPV